MFHGGLNFKLFSVLIYLLFVFLYLVIQFSYSNGLCLDFYLALLSSSVEQ